MIGGLASAAFEGGSLLIPTDSFTPDTQTNGIISISMPTRTANGEGDSRGTVEGTVSLLVSHDTNVWASVIPTIKTFSGNTSFQNSNRYAWSTVNGVLVWDFDFSGITSNAWALVLNTERSNTPNNLDAYSDDVVYISYNGDGLTLDETVITNLAVGAGGPLVDDLTKYRKIAYTPVNVFATNQVFDVSEIMSTAITNGGKVRLVYRSTAFSDDVKFLTGSGFHAVGAVTNATSPVLDYYALDQFNTASGALPQNGWTEVGPEARNTMLPRSAVI